MTTIRHSWKEVEWTEQTQLVKDILWIFNLSGPLSCSFVPRDSFKLKYWEYLSLRIDILSDINDIEFMREGCLIIINGIINEYIPIDTGVQELFLGVSWEKINESVLLFLPSNDNQKKLKEITLLGLKIAMETDLNKDTNDHPDINNYFKKTLWIDKTFIENYYLTKIRKTKLIN